MDELLQNQELTAEELDMLNNNEMSDNEKLARMVVQAIEGVSEDNEPKACIAFALLTFFSQEKKFGTLAEQTMYKPVVSVNPRNGFAEIVFKFPTEKDAGLKVLLSHLNKYSEMQREITSQSVNVPVATFSILPIEAMGTLYMKATDPIFWSVQPDFQSSDRSLKELHMLFAMEDVKFFQTDAINMGDIIASVMREAEANNAYYEELARREDEESEDSDS